MSNFERSPQTELQETSTTPGRPSWMISLVSFLFILLQSGCTIVMAVSGVRVLIGLTAFAAVYGVHRPSHGFHANLYRIPMMVIALGGSILNLYVVWRIRSLRARPSSQWRVAPATPRQRLSENFQIALAIITIVLVLAEEITHIIIHDL